MTPPPEATAEAVGQLATDIVLREMKRIRALFTPTNGDKEDLISYAKEVSGLRASRITPTVSREGQREAANSRICGYPIPGWRLDFVRHTEEFGWVAQLVTEESTKKHSTVATGASKLGPLDAWDAALKVASEHIFPAPPQHGEEVV